MKIGFGLTKNLSWASVFKSSIKNAGHEPVYITMEDLTNKSKNPIYNKEIDMFFMTCYSRGFSTKGLNRQELLNLYNSVNKHTALRMLTHDSNVHNIPFVYADAAVFDELKEDSDCQTITINGPKNSGIEYADLLKEDSSRMKFIENHLNINHKQSHDKEINDVLFVMQNIFGYKSNTESIDDQIYKCYKAIKEIEEKSDKINIHLSLHPKMTDILFDLFHSNQVKPGFNYDKKRLFDLMKKLKEYLTPTSVKKIFLKDYDCCVGWHTNHLCNSLVRQQKYVCLDKENFCYDLGAKSIDNIINNDGFENIINKEKREEWFRKMSWCNWTLSEITEGKMWRPIEEWHQNNQ